MTHSNADKRRAEEADVRAVLAAIGFTQPDLIPGDDPPDFVFRLGGALVPLEHTRLYIEDSSSSPQARTSLWRRLKAGVHEARLPVELELEFLLNDGWPHIPPSTKHAAFISALVTLAHAHSAPFEVFGVALPPELSPFLACVTGRSSALPGEAFGTPDAAFLAVPPFAPIKACIDRKAALLKGRASGAWLVIVLGADVTQPILGVGELEPELVSVNLNGTPLERVYVVDISFRHGYVLQHAAWRRAF